MSTRLASWTWDQKNLPPLSRLVLLCLSERIPGSHTKKQSMIDGIVEDCEIPADQVTEILKDLMIRELLLKAKNGYFLNCEGYNE